MSRRALSWISLLAALALGAALAVGWAYQRTGIVRSVVETLAGPPARDLEEAYPAKPGGPSVDHSTWSALLEEHVTEDGWVDYEGFRRDADRLAAYLGTVESAPFAELGRDEKLALLVNAYNAFTVQLIVDHMPLESIRDIPEDERWKARRWKLGGRLWSLDELEHDEMRANFAEPRVHFVLVCAAAGCPPLAREAYVAGRLDEQLERRTRWVHEHETWFRFDAEAGRVHLTELYSWYRGDFEQAAGSVLEFAARYAPELRQALDAGAEPEIRWIPYDWSLNSVANRSPR